MHQQISITNIGIVDFPAPRRIPAIQCENCEEEVEQSNGTCLCSSKSYHLWIIVKCGNKYGAVKKIMIPTISAISNGTEHTEFCAFFCTFVLSGADGSG